jgi:rubrerythrin
MSEAELRSIHALLVEVKHLRTERDDLIGEFGRFKNETREQRSRLLVEIEHLTAERNRYRKELENRLIRLVLQGWRCIICGETADDHKKIKHAPDCILAP